MSKPDWQAKLPAPLTVGRRKLRTLLDIGAYIDALPAHRKNKEIWKTVTRQIFDGKSAAYVAISFRIALLHDPEP